MRRALVGLAFALAACHRGPPPPAPTPPPEPPKPTLTLLETGDVWGQVEPCG